MREEKVRWVPFKNVGASTIPGFSAVMVSGAELLNNQWILKAERLDDYDGSVIAYTSALPVEVGSYGDCTFDELVWVKYDTGDGTPAAGERWGPEPDSYKVAKHWGDTQVVAVDSENTIVLLQKSPVTRVLGKTDSSHAKGANGTISVYNGTALSEADTSENITATNKFATVASGKWVICDLVNGIWYLTSAEC